MIEGLQALDRTLFLLINSWHAEWLNPAMILLSGQWIWLPFVLFILWYSFKQLERKDFYLFVLFLSLTIIATDVTSSYILKNLVERLRPCRLDELKPFIYSFGQKCGGKYGFVSSHAANSFSLVTYAWLIFRPQKIVFLAVWILPILVAYSRVYLGVHYPGDILVGALLGMIWASVLACFFNHKQLRSKST